MFKSDILFSGYYGHKNTGDDAFVEVSNWGSRKYWGKDNIRYLAKKNDLPEVSNFIKGYPLNIPKTYRLQQHMLLRNAKVLMSAGGSTFHNVATGSIKEITLKYKERLKIGAIGVSLGPFKSIENEKKIVEYLKNINFLALRDKSSYEFAKTLELPYEPIDAFDLAALLPQIYKDKVLQDNTKTKIVGISVCNYESYIKGGNLKNENRRNTFIYELLKEINEKMNVCFKFFVFNGNQRTGDYQLTKEMVERLKLRDNYEIVPYDSKTEHTWRLIKECNVMISTRLHASIFACFADIPFFLIEYHKKCADFLIDVGQAENYRLYDGDVDVIYASQHILNVLNEDYIRPTNKNNMEKKALLNFTAIKL